MASLLGSFTYLETPENQTVGAWILAAVGVVLLVAGIVGMVRLERREKDEAPEFLEPMVGSFFERDGFCFAPVISEEEGQAKCTLFYQNRYLNRSEATVALHPKAKMPSLMFRVSCGPAEYGAVTLPIGIPVEAQGKVVKCSVGASVEYPDGRGKTVRFTTGHEAGAFNSLGGGLPAGLAVVAAMSLTFVKAATTKLTMPSNVNPTVPPEVTPSRETFWEWGDPTEE